MKRPKNTFPCQRIEPITTRRDMLKKTAQGFGAVALTALMAEEAKSSPTSRGLSRAPHYPPRARSVIFLYMDGGPSQVDTFDPKPRLDKEHGEPFKMKIEPTQFNNIGKTLKSPWKFRHYGESGLEISDLFPYVAQSADDLCVIRSMYSNFSEHTNANYFLHTGLGLSGRPSMGAWATYGLGSENRNLPGFVVLNGGLIPPGGLDCFASGFLPATFQGSVFRPKTPPVANIHPLETKPTHQERKLKLLHRLDRAWSSRQGEIDAIESAIANHELAFRMQSAVPDLMGGLPAEVPDRYALGSPAARLPFDVPVVCVHGTDDGNVPIRQSERFVAAAGGSAELVALPGVDHFAVIDPSTDAWAACRDATLRLIG